MDKNANFTIEIITVAINNAFNTNEFYCFYLFFNVIKML